MPRVVIELQANTAEAVKSIQLYAKAQADAFSAVKAGTPALADATVKVSQLSAAKVVATRSAQQWHGVLQVLPGSLGNVASQAANLATVLTGPAGLAAGIVGVGVAIVGMANHFANTIERLDNLSRQTGLSVEALQAFEQAAKEAGESPDTLVQGFGRINAAINDVLMGTKDAGKAFEAIGVPLRQLVKDGASTEEIFTATAKALEGMDDPLKKAAASQELFNTRGRAMTTTLAAVAKQGLPAYIAAMKDAGVVTTEATNQMARDFDELSDRMSRSWTKMRNEAASTALTILKELSDLFNLGAKGANLAAQTRMGILGRTKDDFVGPAPGAAKPRVLGVNPEEAMRAAKTLAEGQVATIRASAEAMTSVIEAQTALQVQAYEAAGATVDEVEAIKQAAIKATHDVQIKAIQDEFEARQKALKPEEKPGAILERDAALRKASTDELMKTLGLEGELFTKSLKRLELYGQQLDTIEDINRAIDSGLVESGARANEQIKEALAAADEARDGAMGSAAEIRAIDEETFQRRQHLLDIGTQGLVTSLNHEMELRKELLNSGTLNEQQAQDQRLRILEIGIERDLAVYQTFQDRKQQIELQGMAAFVQIERQRADFAKVQWDLILQGNIEAARQSLDAWQAFSAGFLLAINRLPDAMQGLAIAGAEVARAMTNAFEEFFFQAMEGKLENAKQVWEAFLDDLKRAAARFLADQTMRGLTDIGTTLVNGITGSGSSTAASSGGGGGALGWLTDLFNIGGSSSSGGSTGGFGDDILQFEQATTKESEKRLVISQKINEEQTKTLVLFGKTGANIGGIIGGLGGATLGSALPGPGTVLGGLGGKTIGAMIGDAIENAIFGTDRTALSKAMSDTAKQAALLGTSLTAAERELLGLDTAVIGATNTAAILGNSFDDATSRIGNTVESVDRTGTALDPGMTDAMAGIEQAASSAKESIDNATPAISDMGTASKDMGTAAKEAGPAIQDATTEITGLVDMAREAADRAQGFADEAAARDPSMGANAPRGSTGGFPSSDLSGGQAGGSGGFGGGGTAPDTGGPGGLGGQGSTPFQHGGFAFRPVRAMLGERGPEAVIGGPGQQFTRDFTAMIAKHLGGGDPELKDVLRALTDALNRLPRGGQGRGWAFN